MEAIEEHLRPISPIAEFDKTHINVENENVAVAVTADLCHKSNGVAEIGEAGQPEAAVCGIEPDVIPKTEISQNTVNLTEISSETMEPNEIHTSSEVDISLAHENEEIGITETSECVQKGELMDTLEIREVITEEIVEHELEKTVCHEVDIIDIGVLDTSSNDTPKFRTEILVEANDSIVDTPENNSTDVGNQDPPNNILNELGENMDLEVLRSSDVTETSENNNSTVPQIFNKEELLDILEGNDVETGPSAPVADVQQVSLLVSNEKKMALQQLTRLKNEKRKYRSSSLRVTKIKKDKKEPREKANCMVNDPDQKKIKNQDRSQKSVDCEIVSSNDSKVNTEKKEFEQATSITEPEADHNENLNKNKKLKKNSSAQSGNIVNALVMDWDDEDQEPNESEETKEILEESNNLLQETEILRTKQEIVNEPKPSARTSVDSVPSEDQASKSKSGDESQPQRRLGRVIKKKVIFDPDNPDTFTKTKAKNRDLLKDQIVKEQPPPKKGKGEQTPTRSKSKSPMANSLWKKPSSKNNKQNKRLTEVDKLLMDEGAVNMIYQLTPEAPKGKKSRETKAEFIKKIQSSTPDSKEMKFRERKKESIKYEDGEPKRILGAKHRVSLNSSIKSPTISEDFETHSADDSIIYRRHSSSSYSSSCMSPRRLSDVDSCPTQSNLRLSQPVSGNQSQDTASIDKAEQEQEVFMSDSVNKSSSDIINKDDVLSIKEKLNSKLSLALNKRKRESNKNDPKPSKLKKVNRNEENTTKSLGEFKHVTIKINQRLAEILIENTEVKNSIEVLQEIEQALAFINSIKETSVTLLTSSCGTLCSSLDTEDLIQDDQIKRESKALEIAETIRSLLLSVDKHSKLVCVSVGGACRGAGLALAALADVVLAGERATFALPAGPAPRPGAAALAARCRLPHSTVNDLILFGRQLSASEALNGGLVSRVLWPERFTEQVYGIAKEIAAEPLPNVMLKKRLISLKKTAETEQTFLSCLDAERDAFVEYWSSPEAQDQLRADNA